MDRITDFTRTQRDLIDLSAVDTDEMLAGAQSFSFIGTAAFTGALGSGYELGYQAIADDDLDLSIIGMRPVTRPPPS